MASSGKKMCSTMELTELKKDSLQNVITSLTLEWNDVHTHLHSTQRYLEDRFTELESREKHLLSIQDSVTESNKHLDSIHQSLEESAKQIEQLQDDRMKKFNSTRVEVSKLQDERMHELNLKEKQLDLREEKLDAHQKSIDVFFEKLDSEMQQFQSIQKCVGEKLEEINLKERKLDSRERLLKLAQNFYDECRKEFQSHNAADDLCDIGAPLRSSQGLPGAKGVTAGSNSTQPALVDATKPKESGGSRKTSMKRAWKSITTDKGKAVFEESGGKPVAKQNFVLESIDDQNEVTSLPKRPKEKKSSILYLDWNSLFDKAKNSSE